jgi:hypothetical protein
MFTETIIFYILNNKDKILTKTFEGIFHFNININYLY